MPISGHCLCGQVKIEIASAHDTQIACHCLDCKATSGSAFSTNILAKTADVKLEGPVKEYDSPAISGNTVTRMFCGNCGSAIAHKSKAFGDAMAIQTGSLPDLAKVPFAVELFTKDRWTGLEEIQGAQQVPAMM